mgnify:CR=1 FL=1
MLAPRLSWTIITPWNTPLYPSRPASESCPRTSKSSTFRLFGIASRMGMILFQFLSRN